MNLERCIHRLTLKRLTYDTIKRVLFILQGCVGRLMAIQAMTLMVARCRMHGLKPGGRLLTTFLTAIVAITEYITSFAQRMLEDDITCSL